MVRAAMVNGLVECAREAELDPARLGALLLDLLSNEQDPDTHGWLLDALAVTLQRWLPKDRAAPLSGRATELLLGQLQHEADSGRDLQTFRFLARNSTDPVVLQMCRQVAAGREWSAGLKPGKQDRFLAAAALLAAGADAGEIDSLAKEFANTDPAKEVFMARAAAPDAAVKESYWQQFLRREAPPEQWVQDSLAWFHWPGQASLTSRYLGPALERVEWVKANRRIFFMPAWIDAFVNCSDDPEAVQTVQKFLRESRPTPDVERKVLQSMDALQRAVKVRRIFSRTH